MHSVFFKKDIFHHSTTKQIFAAGGLRPFFVGCKATILRDIVFGGLFCAIRHELCVKPRKKGARWLPPHIEQFGYKFIAGCIATVLSSPMNYVR